MPTQEEINQAYLDAIAVAKAQWGNEQITHSEYHTEVQTAHAICIADMWAEGYIKPTLTRLEIDAEEIAADGVDTATLTVRGTKSKSIDLDVYFLANPEEGGVLELDLDGNGEASATMGPFAVGTMGTLQVEPGEDTWGDVYAEMEVV